MMKIVICGSLSQMDIMKDLKNYFDDDPYDLYSVTIPDASLGQPLMKKRINYTAKIKEADLVVVIAKAGNDSVYLQPTLDARYILDSCKPSKKDVSFYNAIIGYEFGEATSYELAMAAMLHKHIWIVTSATVNHELSAENKIYYSTKGL